MPEVASGPYPGGFFVVTHLEHNNKHFPERGQQWRLTNSQLMINLFPFLTNQQL